MENRATAAFGFGTSAGTEIIAGAQPEIRSEIFPRWPEFAREEIETVARVLESGKVNYWTGPHGKAFEAEFAWSCGVNHGVALSNGTVALEAALRALRVGPGDEVVVTPRSFFASASCIVSVGARPVFADVDPDTQNITAATIEPVVTPKTKAILAVHLGGVPCEMTAIQDLAGRHGLYVIEDCAQAHGARYRGSPVGSFGHAAAFSFCQDKIMTTGGEGGMLVTDDDCTWKRAWSFKEHGKSRELALADHAGNGFRWLHEGFGTNGRMTEMQAALGRIQLKKLPEWHGLRTRNARMLSEGFATVAGLRVPELPGHLEPGWYKYYAFVRPDALREGWTRDRVREAVAAAGVPCFSGSCPEIYREQAFREAGGAEAARLPIAQELGETSLMFLVHPTLDEMSMDTTVETVARVMAEAVR